jgi:hypothetical protein
MTFGYSRQAIMIKIRSARIDLSNQIGEAIRLAEIFGQLDQKIVNGEIGDYTQVTFKVFGQCGLLEANLKLELEATQDIDAYNVLR